MFRLVLKNVNRGYFCYISTMSFDLFSVYGNNVHGFPWWRVQPSELLCADWTTGWLCCCVGLTLPALQGTSVIQAVEAALAGMEPSGSIMISMTLIIDTYDWHAKVGCRVWSSNFELQCTLYHTYFRPSHKYPRLVKIVAKYYVHFNTFLH